MINCPTFLNFNGQQQQQQQQISRDKNIQWN